MILHTRKSSKKRLLAISIFSCIFLVTESAQADCTNVLSEFRESHYLNLDAHKSRAIVNDACSKASGSGKFFDIGGGFNSSNCSFESLNEEQRIQLVKSASIIRAQYAVEAYQACISATSNKGSGFFVWVENTSGGGFTVNFKLVAPFACTETGENSNIYKCNNRAKLRIKADGAGSDALNAPQYCPGQKKRNGFLGNAFDDYQDTVFHAEKGNRKGTEIHITCRGKKTGPLILTFKSTDGYTSPTPSKIVIP